MPAYDLLAIDIDGTLLTSQNRIPNSIFPLLREVEACGVGVMLISGRPEMTVAPLMRELGLTLPCVSSGGAQITDMLTGESIASWRLAPEVVEKLAQLGRGFGVHVMAMERDCLYFEGRLEELERVQETVDIHLANGERIRTRVLPVADIVQVAPTPLKLTLSAQHERLLPVAEKLRASNLPVYFTYSTPVYLESTNIQANKGSALQWLARHLNIPMQRVLALGDSPNDISMLKVAGLGIAMGNAHPAVKAVAGQIVPSNDEEGVSWVLRELVLKAGSSQK
ncbi:MAG TPA: Cof-type HAD-IIB family hydrolase [Ktedonobacteraceae bacterium]